MVIYNIIYSAPGNKTFLWNGNSFDLLESADAGKLFYSGKTYSDDQVKEAVLKSREAARCIFSEDTDPKIEKMEIPVHHNQAEGGHAHVMSS